VSELVGVLVSSIFLGTALGMIALGFSVAYTVSRVFNFAVGQFMILAALMATTLHITGSPVVNDLVAILLVSLMGAATYLLTLRWPESHGADPLTLVIITFGVGIIIEQIVDRVWGSYGLSAPSVVAGGFRLSGNLVAYQGLVLIGVSLAVVVALTVVQRRTVIGKQLVALGSDRLSSRYFGISDLTMVTVAWAISFLVIAVAGTLYLPLTGVSIGTDLTFGIDAFAAAVVGGLGSPGGSLAGGLIVGLVTTATGVYINPNIGDVFTFGLLFLFLVARPSGLTGKAADLLAPRA